SRKMRRQLLRHRLDPPDDAAGKIPRFEITLHRLAYPFPAVVAYLGVDAAVGDDLDVTICKQKIDQHAIIMGGIPDAQPRENIQRALPRQLIAEQRLAVE